MRFDQPYEAPIESTSWHTFGIDSVARAVAGRSVRQSVAAATSKSFIVGRPETCGAAGDRRPVWEWSAVLTRARSTNRRVPRKRRHPGGRPTRRSDHSFAIVNSEPSAMCMKNSTIGR